MAHRQVGGARWVALAEGIVQTIREEQVATVGAPARRVEHDEALKVGDSTQPSCHVPNLRVLLTLSFEEVLLDRGGDCIPSSVGRIVNGYLRIQRPRDGQGRNHQEQKTSHDCLLSNFSGLAPGPKRIAASSNERLIGGMRVAPCHELHVDSGGLGVPKPLAARQ
jgi:hypothetical protein